MSEPDAPVVASQPGSRHMPSWHVGQLPDAPRFSWKHWTMLLGPGLLMGGAAIGGGEWLMGPIVSARYGGALLWLATLSVLGQVIYNIEISRYTLYTGEPIFTGKFRTLPGPAFWIFAYLLMDFGSFFPYLASTAATPLLAAFRGSLPDPNANPADEVTLRWISLGIFLFAMVPLVVGGKVYNSLKAVISFKVIAVMGFLLVVAAFWSTPATWWEIGGGFFKFGNVPIQSNEDRNGNGTLDPGEDWDSDGRLDVIEPSLALVFDTDGDGKKDATDVDGDGQPDPMVTLPDGIRWIDLDQDGRPDSHVTVSIAGDHAVHDPFPVLATASGAMPKFIDIDGDGIRDGANVDNIILAAAGGRELPPIDWSMIAFLSALVAISGSGGLTNTSISNYTRDQGWGMGYHVGAIPSMIGGRSLTLSHVGTVFEVTPEVLPRWKRWYRHILRDQLAIWMPACFFGLALPSMLSIQFLRRGTEPGNPWEASVMTAGGLRDAVGGGQMGTVFWFLTLFCGFLVLAPSMAVTVDGVIRRWVDGFWTASPWLRRLRPGAIRQVYFGVLLVYAVIGMSLLFFQQPTTLILISTSIYNFALGLSCWHVLWVNRTLLPRELKPGIFASMSMFVAGFFFLFVATVSALQQFVWN